MGGVFRGQVAVLGPLRVQADGRDVPVSGLRLRRLLLRLAVDADRPVPTTALVAAIWPDEPPADAGNALQALVSRLRRALGDPGSVVPTPGGYRLAVPPAALDTTAFTELAGTGRERLRAGDPAAATAALDAALERWRAEPLTEAGGADYAEPLLARWTQLRLDAAADRAEALLQLGRTTEALPELEALVAEHPLRERLVGLLMRAYAASGRTPEALQRYDALRRRLAAELGVDPGPQLQQVHLALLRGELAGPPAAVDRRQGRGTNLRAELTSFIGREDDLARVGALLAAGRLTTIVGPGGVGKTRLAGEAAGRLADRCPDGVWLVELAPVTDGATLPAAFLDALGLRDPRLLDRLPDRGRDTASRLHDLLAAADCLLVVDNCEHLVGDVAQLVAELLARAPRLRVLATSREPLGITGEALVPVAPLPLPPVDADPDAAAGYPAVRLLVDRGTAARPGFALDAATVGDVLQIVRRLDGLPLAIELAAARMRVLPVREIAARLDDRFRLLSDGGRVVMPRHRTLRAVVEWSWDLLTPAERLLAERLAVFPAGATAESAAAVCGDDELDPRDVPDLLIALVDKSLLQAVDDPVATRYRMLETLREYGTDRLAERAELAAARLGHARWFARLAQELDPALRTGEQVLALRRLDAERENVLAALRLLTETGRGAEAVDLVLALGWYWTLTGNDGDAAHWFRVALDAPGSDGHPFRGYAEAGLLATTLAVEQADADRWQQTRARLERLLTGLDELPPLPARLNSLAAMGPMLAYYAHAPELATAMIDRAFAEPDPWVRGMAHLSRGSFAENTGRVAAGRADIDAAYQLFERAGDRWGLSMTLALRGWIRTLDGDLDGAVADYERAAAAIALLGDTEDGLFLQLRLGDLHTRRGEHAAARRAIEDARRNAARLTGAAERTLFLDVELATLCWLEGDLDGALRAADEIRDRLAARPLPVPQRGHMVAVVASGVAVLAAAAGRVEQAAADLRLAYRMAVDTRDQPIVAGVAVAVGWLAAALDQPREAAVLLGAAAALRGADDPTDRSVGLLTERVRAALDDAGFAAAHAAGRALDRAAAFRRVDPARLHTRQQVGSAETGQARRR